MVSSIGNKEIFARNLKYYMDRSGKTQIEIAEDLNISTSTFNNWAMGNTYPRIDKIEMLANYFGIQKSDLIEEKLTEEKEKDNDILADIIVRARMDQDFREALESLYSLDSNEIKGVTGLLQAFKK